MEEMALYVHIPFCKRKCSYCDFASCAGREGQMAEYCRCLTREIALRAQAYGPVPVSTAYIGGGTPSLLPPHWMAEVLQSLFCAFPLLPGAEVTCEANPGTLTEAFLQALKAGGVNRISLGAQARQPHLLNTLGRIHRWEAVESSVALARQAGFDNINIDLMFGLPGQTEREWRETIKAALALEPEHISCYGLILEEGTALHRRVHAGELSLPETEQERAMYEDALHLLGQAGLAPYEISNFALPGRACRHNLGYWQGAYYLGLGTAAHSRMPLSGEEGAYARFGNTPDLEAYMESLNRGEIPVAEYEAISPREAEFETLMLGLRVLQGVGEQDFLCRHGRGLDKAFGAKIAPLVDKGLLAQKDGFLCLTRRGMDVQNAVLVALMD